MHVELQINIIIIIITIVICIYENFKYTSQNKQL
jgi:hypothetical protein